MALTRKQALVAGLLVLAGEAQAAAALPGATIAQQAAAPKPGVAAGQGHTGPPKKVASPKGSAFFKAPIGTLIIPHEHFVKGQPSHMIHSTSEAKWVANQWKTEAGKKDADDAAHKAVESGTHKWVQSGEHEFAVHKDIDVHVPKDTDLHNPAAVKAAPKVFAKKDEDGKVAEHAYFHPSHPETSEAAGTTDAAADLIAKHWKKLPDEPAQKSVSFGGKHAAWVPHDWKVYKAPHSPDLAGKWAKDPQGGWHFIDKAGPVENAKEPHDDWVKNGNIVSDDDRADKHAVLPAGGEKAPGKLKAEVAAKEGPPLAVTKDEIQHALKILQDDKSTAVKQPLAKKGHSLAGMDYHQIAKEELAKHPELKVSAGTKKEHVGQVKLAVIHHLAGRVAHLAHSEAEAEALEAAQDKAKADAEHAQQLTPHAVTLPKAGGEGTIPVYVGSQLAKEVPAGSQVFVWHKKAEDKAGAPKYVKFPDGSWHYYTGVSNPFENLSGNALEQVEKDFATGKLLPAGEEPAGQVKVGGITATKEDVQGAIDALSAAKSTSIKQVLKAKGNPLADTDYWAVIHAYEKAHPNTAPKAHGTKQAHVGNAKQLFIAALQEKAGNLAKADEATGHDQYHELYDLVTNGKLKPGYDNNPVGAIAWAAKKATDMEATYYALPYAGKWAVSVVNPKEGHYYKVTPQLTAVDQDGTSAQTLLWNAAHLWLEKPAGESQAAAPPAPEHVPQEPEVSWEISANTAATWKADPQWKELHAKVKGTPLAQLYTDAKSHTLVQHIARLLVFASDAQVPKYLNTKGGDWSQVAVKPPEGTWGAPSSAFYEVTPDHQVILHTANGGVNPWPHDVVLNALDKGLKTATPHEEAVKNLEKLQPAPTYHHHEFVPGAVIYKKAGYKDDTRWVQYPDGKWSVVTPDTVVQHQLKPDAPASKAYAAEVKSGSLVPDTASGAEEPAPENLAQASEPEPQGVPATDKGVYAGEFPAGSKVYQKTDGSHQGTYALDLAGKWWVVKPAGTYGNGLPSIGEAPSWYNLAADEMTPQSPPPAYEIAHGKEVAAALEVIKTGTASAASAISSTGSGYNEKKIFPTWQEAAVFALATSHKGGGSAVDVIPDEGGFRYAAGLNSAEDEYYRVDAATLQVKYSPPGDKGTMAPAKLQADLLQAVKAQVVPGAVTVDGKIFGFGYWKNPKGKSYILIKPNNGYTETWKYGTAAHGEYTYYDSNGEYKSVTPKFAAKQLAKATEFSDKPFPPPEVPPEKFGHATVLDSPASYHIWSSDEMGPSSTGALDTKTDSSAVLHGQGAPAPLTPMTLEGIMKAGAVLDEYGNTVVLPGLQPSHYHIWGSTAKAKAQLQEMVTWLDANPDEQWAPKVKEFLAGDSGAAWKQVAVYSVPFMNAHGAVTGTGQRAAFTALLKELLAVPQLPEGSKVGQPGSPGKSAHAGPVFLKSMPPGITQAKDIFTYTQLGWVVPFQGSLASYGLTTKPELKAKIQEISQQFGNGQVVGAHLSGLTMHELESWLEKWKAGDMAAVFELDATAGKVSPAHPGAPDNAETHQVTWSPADPNQVPASQDIPGNWSDLSEVSTLPLAEVANYLIKMGAQAIAEYLTPAERQTLVRAHRTHIQEQVDSYTTTALQRQAGGEAPLSEPPVWTEGLKPAKPYDSYVANSEPAGNWTTVAVQTFVKDHQAEVMPYLEKVAQDNGYSPQYLIDHATYYLTSVVQDWLDNEHAKLVAEQSVPVWKKVPAGELPSHGHEVWKATRTIPYTGASTTWFVKPAPDGKVFRLEQEHAANLLGRLFGFGSAESQLLTDPAFGSEQVQAQKAIPGEPLGHYTDMPPWSDFTPQQVADIATEHLLDWVLANDDSSANNMIKKPDGHIAGIDKGRSWGDMSWPLSSNSSMDTMTQLVYTKLYNAVRSHQLTKDAADKAYIQVIQRARKMAAVPDNRVQGILDAGFAHRTKWGEFGSRQGLVDEVLRRKNNVEADFAKLWGQLYQDAGIGELPEVPQNKLQDAHGAPLHSGFSEPDFADHVAAGKSHGVPAFFGGPELRDMHVLVWQQKSSQGTVTHGETFMKGSAYSKVVNWLKTHTGKNSAAAAASDTITSYPGDQYGPGKPPDGSPDRGGLTGEREIYTKIIRAARSATKHKSDGDYTKASSQQIWKDLADTQKKLQDLKTGADEVLNGNPDESNPAVQQMKLLLDMANLYLDHAAKVTQAKQGAYGFSDGELPRWVAPEPAKKAEPKDELAALGIKLQSGASAVHDMGSLDENSGEFKPNASYTHTDPGKWWRMTLPDGEVIELGNGSDTGVELSHSGRIRFRTSDGSAASLERIRSALQLTGLELPEAQPADFEQFYWRHLLAVMADRADGGKQPVWSALHNRLTDLGLKSPGMSSTDAAAFSDALDELAKTDPEAAMKAYRAAFATLTSPEQVQEWADKGGFFPRQKHFDPTAPAVAGGKPDWYRFDLAAKVPDLPMPIRQSSNTGAVAENVVKNGGTYGKDALMRVAGIQADGMGNPYTSGGPAFVFTRLNVHESRAVVLTPLALARSHNYSFEDDSYGEWKYRATQAHWNPSVWSNYNGGSNETMINDAMSLLDDVELVQAYGDAQRQSLIAWLKGRGINEIRHMPVEDRVVKAINSASIAKVKANYVAHPELLDPLAEHGLPYTGATEAEAKTAEQGAEAAKAKQVQDLVDTYGQVYAVGGVPFSNGFVFYKDSQGNWWQQPQTGQAHLVPDGVTETAIADGNISLIPQAKPATDAGKAAQVLYQYPDGSGSVAMPADWKVYKSSNAHPTDASKLWGKDPQGNWHFAHSKAGGPAVPNSQNNDIHNQAVEEGGFVPVNGVALPSQPSTSDLLGKVMTASLGPEWTQVGTGKFGLAWKKGDYQITKVATGFDVSHYTGEGMPQNLGTFDTLQQAAAVAQGEEPPF